jgi:tripartite-type tricarboxylate transporter receptor subunit TctC
MSNASSLSGVLDYYKNGKLKILAISTPERHPSIPDVPTFKELGYNAVTGYSIYRGWYAKAGVKKEYIEVLEQLCQLVYNDPEWKGFMKTLGKEENWKNSKDFTKWYQDIVSSTASLGIK